MDYKQIIHQEGYNALMNLKSGIKVSVLYDRDLTEDEIWMVQRHVNEILKEIRKNSKKNSPSRQVEIAKNKANLLVCFPSNVYVKEIPNGYYADDIEPWYKVTTSKGPITIGWRKRVISIDWSESDVDIPAHVLFPEEDVTKYDNLIHAWSYDKAKEYLAKILSH